MPVDRETMSAIHALADGLRSSIDARLDEHKSQADTARARIYEKIDGTSTELRNAIAAHAVESRTQLAASTAELRGSMITLGTQVTDLSARFGAHEKADAKEFERVDEALQEQAKRKHGYLQTILAAVAGAIAGWLSMAIGGQGR